MIKEISSYPKIHNVGHPEIMDFFDDPVLIEEKIDGSQISFMLRHDGELFIKSKKQMIEIDCPEKMFQIAVDEILALKHLLTPNFIYRGEYLKKPHHNALTYERVPAHHIILYDVEISPNAFMPLGEKDCRKPRPGTSSGAPGV